MCPGPLAASRTRQRRCAAAVHGCLCALGCGKTRHGKANDMLAYKPARVALLSKHARLPTQALHHPGRQELRPAFVCACHGSRHINVNKIASF